jgi:GTP cyclohydrolase II
MDELRRLGVTVEKRLPVLIPANPFSASYLEVKRRRMQHELPSNPQALAEPATVLDTATSTSGRRAAQ